MKMIWRLLGGGICCGIAGQSVLSLIDASHQLDDLPRWQLLATSVSATIFLGVGLFSLFGLHSGYPIVIGIIVSGLAAELMVEPSPRSVTGFIIAIWLAGLTVWLAAIARSFRQ